MKILAVDSSAVSGSVCILDDGNVRGSCFENTKQTHSRTLMVMVEQLLRCSDTALNDIDLFAVTAGPGSFTGVRIGVACIKGMAMALDKPCVGVSTLEAMASQCGMINGVVCGVMDARCNQVYNALFEVKNGRVTRLTEDRAISIDELCDELKEINSTIYLIGDGTNVCLKNEELSSIEKLVVMPESSRYQTAVGTALCAMKNYESGNTVSAGELQPVYLRLPQAERELKKKQGVI